ncbi:hypothetical protein D3C76_1455830 [compost metagenome]
MAIFKPYSALKSSLFCACSGFTKNGWLKVCVATSTLGLANNSRAIGSSSRARCGNIPRGEISPSMIDTEVRNGLGRIKSSSTCLPAYGEPRTSAREGKPSPSICTVAIRRPFSVVVSGRGCAGKRNAAWRNAKGSMIQRLRSLFASRT